jgi:7-keto-8-aminopelargonate synthetase-like enzyme
MLPAIKHKVVASMEQSGYVASKSHQFVTGHNDELYALESRMNFNYCRRGG